jgi:hypothetical protein
MQSQDKVVRKVEDQDEVVRKVEDQDEVVRKVEDQDEVVQSQDEVVVLLSCDNQKVQVERNLLLKLAPTFEPSCTSFKVGVDGQTLEQFVKFLCLYRDHNCGDPKLPAKYDQAEICRRIVPEPMWDLIESLPHCALRLFLKAALQLKTKSVYNFVSTIGTICSLKHPHRDPNYRCFVCYPLSSSPHRGPNNRWCGKYCPLSSSPNNQQSHAQDAQVLSEAVAEAQRIEAIENW